jgi:hypothetical protein
VGLRNCQSYPTAPDEAAERSYKPGVVLAKRHPTFRPVPMPRLTRISQGDIIADDELTRIECGKRKSVRPSALYWGVNGSLNALP